MNDTQPSNPKSATAQTPLLSEHVTEGIRELILSGKLAPGSRIGQEELAQRFGTSRIPVREALRRLESDGLVHLVPNSSAWVAKLDLAECIEVYKMRERIEPLAIGESLARMTDADIDRLEKLAKEMEEGPGGDEFLRCDREFHLLSYQAAAMPRLISTVERYWNTTQHYRRAFIGLFGSRPDRITHCEHCLLIAALRRRDRADAEHLVASHIRRTRVELERHREVFQQADTGKRKRTRAPKRKP